MSRFDIVKFISPPDEEFICGICRNVLDDAKESPCRHVFCQVCITRALKEKSKCPICRTSFRERHLKDILPLVQNLLNKLPMACDNKVNGCEDPIPLERYLNHVQNCEYFMVTCKNASCGKRLLKRNCEDHESNDCELRKIICTKGCKSLVVFAETKSHDCLSTLLQLTNELNEKNKELESRVNELTSIITSFDANKSTHKNDEDHGSEASLGDSLIGSPIRSLSRSISRSPSGSPRSRSPHRSPSWSGSPASSYSFDIDYNSMSDMPSLASDLHQLSSIASDLQQLSDISDNYGEDDFDPIGDLDGDTNSVEVVEEFEPMSGNTLRNGRNSAPASCNSYAIQGTETVSSSNNWGSQAGQTTPVANSCAAAATCASSSSCHDFPSSSTGACNASGPNKQSRKRLNLSTDDHPEAKIHCRECRYCTAQSNDNSNSNSNTAVRRSARLRQIPASPVNDVDCVPVPATAAYLLDMYSNEGNSNSDDSWSPTRDRSGLL